MAGLKAKVRAPLAVTTLQTMFIIPSFGMAIVVFGVGKATTSAYMLVELEADAAIAVGASTYMSQIIHCDLLVAIVEHLSTKESIFVD